MAGGLACTFATTTIHVKDKDKPEEYVLHITQLALLTIAYRQQSQSLNNELSQLRQQVSDLVGMVRELNRERKP